MQTNESFHIFKIREELSKRQRNNPHYSLRSFARDIQIDSSNLSAILRNKRGLPGRRAEHVAKKLNLSPLEKNLFLLSVKQKETRLDQIQVTPKFKKYLLEDAHYKIIAEWEYYAVLKEIEIASKPTTVDTLAARLGISLERAQVVVQALLDAKFIRPAGTRGYKRCVSVLETSEDIVSEALQKSHAENLNLAAAKLKDIDVALRDFSSVTIGVNLKKLAEAKAVIREFQDKLQSLLEDEKASEIYIFSCQFFPVSKPAVKE